MFIVNYSIVLDIELCFPMNHYQGNIGPKYHSQTTF